MIEVQNIKVHSNILGKFAINWGKWIVAGIIVVVVVAVVIGGDG